MVVNLVAAVPIEAITVPGKPAIIVAGSDKLDQPFKTAERRGRIGVEIEDDLIMGRLRLLARDHDGSFESVGVMRHAMRDESIGSVSPQQLVEAARRVLIRRVYDDAQLLPGRFGGKLAGDLQLGLGVRVEVNACHGETARFMRNVVSKGTGRPVAPFSLPDFHAVPAMSR